MGMSMHTLLPRLSPLASTISQNWWHGTGYMDPCGTSLCLAVWPEDYQPRDLWCCSMSWRELHQFSLKEKPSNVCQLTCHEGWKQALGGLSEYVSILLKNKTKPKTGSMVNNHIPGKRNLKEYPLPLSSPVCQEWLDSHMVHLSLQPADPDNSEGLAWGWEAGLPCHL